jgi:hypothetical protein
MRDALVSLALVATVMAQGVTQTIAPPGAAPADCVADMNGKYDLTVDAIEPGLAKRQEPVTVRICSKNIDVQLLISHITEHIGSYTSSGCTEGSIRSCWIHCKQPPIPVRRSSTGMRAKFSWN